MRLSMAPPVFDGEVTREELGKITKPGLYKIKEEPGIVKYGNGFLTPNGLSTRLEPKPREMATA